MNDDVSKALVRDNASHQAISRSESPTLQRAASSRFGVAETRQLLSTKIDTRSILSNRAHAGPILIRMPRS
jgi:hypothetical protein